MIRSSKYHPFMVYLEPKEIKRLKKFSVKHKIPMTQVVREAIDAFPSGMSIAELIDQDLSDKKMRFFDEETTRE